MDKMTQGQMKVRQSQYRQAWLDAKKEGKPQTEIDSLYEQYRECKAMCNAGAHTQN